MPKAVRMGSSVKKTLPTPQRIKVMETSGHSVSNFNHRLAAIEEAEKSDLRPAADDKRPGDNISMSDLFGGLALNTPSQGVKAMERSHGVSMTGHQDKISPDSGSFTMSSTKSRIHDTREDFTDSLKNPVSAGSSMTKAARVAPVRT